MLKSRLRQHPGEYGHHCGGGQLATYEVQPEQHHGSQTQSGTVTIAGVGDSRPPRCSLKSSTVYTSRMIAPNPIPNVPRGSSGRMSSDSCEPTSLTLRRGRRTSARRDAEPVSP